MPNGITILERKWIFDPATGRKEIITYSVDTVMRIDEILKVYPGTPNGSFALCIPEGVCKNLINGLWV